MTDVRLSTAYGEVRVTLTPAGRVTVEGPPQARELIHGLLARCRGARGRPILSSCTEAELLQALDSDLLRPYPHRPC